MNQKYIKYFLYALLVLIGLSLWNTWQREHPPVQQKPQTTQVSNQANLPPAQTQSSNTQTITPPKAAGQSSVSSNDQLGKIPSNRLINVKTDVLDLKIDTLGGNIVHSDLLKYPETLHSKNSVVLLNTDPSTFYVAKSGITAGNKYTDRQQLQYQVKQKEFVLKKGKKELVIDLEAKTANGLEVIKQFKFKPDDYEINVHYKLKNTSQKAWMGSYYMEINHSGKLAAKSGILGFHSFFGIAYSSPKHAYEKIKFSKLKEEPLDQNIQNGWLAVVQHYFLGAWVPQQNINYHYFSRLNNNGIYTAGMVGPRMTIQPGQSNDISSNFYVGPKIAKRLEAVAPHLQLTIDYGWLWFLAIAIFWVLKTINNFVGNWGWSIILVTILIKLLFYKLSETSYKSMAGMRKLQPKIKRLKEQVGGDKQALSKATMELYRKEKINPLGGCFPILIQIPVFIALYWVLIESVELRQAPFIFWIHDLSVKDPYYILPILMGISMYFQQKLTPTASIDPTQQKMMMFLPVIMTVFFLNFPAGLVLYWLVNNVLSILQQWYIMRKFDRGDYDKKKGKKRKSFWTKLNAKPVK